MKKVINYMKDMYETPVSIKNLRICVILIAIYQALISHIVLFMMLLGLAHAEKVVDILVIDIDVEREREEYYGSPVNSKGESLNQIRFESASRLASFTLTTIYICTAISAIYLLCCVSLLIGTLRSRAKLMVPWLLFNFIGGIILFAFLISIAGPDYYKLVGGRFQFWFSFACGSAFNIVTWYLCYSFFLNLMKMQKLTEVATVPIPCAPPGAIPYHFRKENMYIGDGGYKHLISENSNPNYVV